MSNKLTWIKDNVNKELCIKMLLAALLPLLLCVVYCLKEGAWIGQLHLGSAGNNDTLFYYTQVSAVVEHGYPRGYFGFNESNAELLSFAAWSPLMLLPWILWGKLFGWNMWSPFLCNIFLFALVCVLLIYWIRPTYKQMLACGSMLLVFPGFARYTMSCLAEMTFVCFMLLFYGLAIGYARTQKRSYLISMLVFASFLAWLRPYFVLLLFLPGFFWVRQVERKKVWVPIGTTLGLFVADLGAYFAIQKYLTAEYFSDLFNWNLITPFFEQGFGAGFGNFLYYVRYMVGELSRAIKMSLTTGAYLGSNYCVLGLLVALLVVWLILARKKEENAYFFVYIHYLFSAVISVVALLLLMQKVNETSRHIMSFVAVGMVLLGLTVRAKWKNAWMVGFVLLMCVYLYHLFPNTQGDYPVPVVRQEAVLAQEAWEEIYANLELTEDDVPTFENTVVWVYSDLIEGETVRMTWQHMLSLPAGMGVSCCTSEYLLENWDNLQSRYISTNVGGRVDEQCKQAGFEKLGEAYGNALYKRY